jgi:hypothetical protein
MGTQRRQPRRPDRRQPHLDPDLDHDLGHIHRAPQQVDPAPAQSDQLPDAQPP